MKPVTPNCAAMLRPWEGSPPVGRITLSTNPICQPCPFRAISYPFISGILKETLLAQAHRRKFIFADVDQFLLSNTPYRGSLE